MAVATTPQKENLAPLLSVLSEDEEGDQVFKSVRFPTEKLSRWVDRVVQDNETTRGAYIRWVSIDFAKDLLEGKLAKEHYLPFEQYYPRVASIKVGGGSIRTNIALRREETLYLEKAASRVNQRISPFLTWATIISALKQGYTYPKEKGLSKKERKSTAVAIRFPLDLLEVVDAYCLKNKINRSEFARLAVSEMIEDVKLEAMADNLLSKDYTVRGVEDSKMASFKVDPAFRVEVDKYAAVLNHTTTGFYVWASWAYLRNYP